MLKVSNKTFVLATTLLYAGIFGLISFHHIVWRDDVVPMTVAIQSSSLVELCTKIHSFGHPVLWYFLLYLVHQVIHPYWALKLVNFLVCVGAIYLLLAKAPFSRLQKILFILGFFPLYLYPILNRDYGISMLLLFAFASLYPRRFDRMIPIGFILFLLANAHAHSLIIVIAILMAFLSEFLFFPESRRLWLAHQAGFTFGLLLMIVGIVCCIIQIRPDHNNIIFDPHPLSLHEIAKAFVKSVLLPGKAFAQVMGVPSSSFTTLAVFCVYAYLVKKPSVFIFFSGAVIGLSIFYHLIYTSDEMRHQGALYFLMITVFWIESYAPQVALGTAVEKFWDFIARYKSLFLTGIFVLQIGMAILPLKTEITHVYSSSKSFGQMLKASSQFKDAVLVGEPGAMLEAIPYYADNPIYLPREGKFKKYTEFTTDQELQYSLEELLVATKKVKSQTGKTVLIVMGHKLSSQGPFLIKFTHGRSFLYTKESLDDFYAQTTRVAVFNKATTDENYSVYLLK